MSQIPRETTVDSTAALFIDGYEFVTKRCRKYRSDVFATRLLLETAVCGQGEEAARVFYNNARVTRRGGLPRTALELLLDFGSVTVLDGDAHRHRKGMFMSLMTPERIADLAERTAAEWHSAIGRWHEADRVVLIQDAREILCRAVCAWAGIPLGVGEGRQRAHDMDLIIDGAGSVGIRQLRGRRARQRAEEWALRIVRSIRAGDLDVAQGRAAHTIAWHRELNGELLDDEVAAVELLNIVRPTVAISRFATFAALALHEYPECRRRIQAGPEDELHWFVQEVRRFYPFFPLIAGRVKEEFEWMGHRFRTGTWLLLDLYGTNHDPRVWAAPDEFRPWRFRDWSGSPFDFIPQGGGDHDEDHRCAGEWITIELMKVAVRALATRMSYDVPTQDLQVSLSRMPAMPNSGLVIRNVTRAG